MTVVTHKSFETVSDDSFSVKNKETLRFLTVDSAVNLEITEEANKSHLRKSCADLCV